MQNFIIRKSYTVELSIGASIAAGNIIPFPDIPQLRNAFITGIETYTSSQLVTTPLGAAVVSATGAKSLVLTFTEKVDEKIQLIPYTAFNTDVNKGFIKAIRKGVIDFQKSNLQLTATTGLTASEAILITFFYED